MKKATLTLMIFTLMTLCGIQSINATNPISAEANIALSSDGSISADFIMKTQETKIGKFFSKIKKGAQKLFSKAKAAFYNAAGKFSDPVKKWLWFWLLGALLAVILFAIAVAVALGGSGGLATALWYIGGAASTFSGISFIIWIIKMIQS